MTSCIEIITKNVILANYEMGKTYLVHVTHINHPHSFFVRPKEWKRYLIPLNTHFDDFKGPIILNSVVVYKSNITKDYIRGQIKDVHETEDSTVIVDIFAMDFGFLEKGVPAMDLKNSVHIEIEKCPPTVTECILADCVPVGSTDEFTNDAVIAMSHFVGSEVAKMAVKRIQHGLLTVNLHNESSQDIATCLVYCGHSTFGYNHNIINRLTAPECVPVKCFFQHRQLEVDEVLHVRHILGKSLKMFYVSTKDDYKLYLLEKVKLKQYCAKLDKIDPSEVKKGLPVAVYTIGTNEYERGEVMKVMDPMRVVLVKFVDTGDTQTVPVSRLTPMPSMFFHRPAALFCSADQTQVWDNILHNVLYPGYEFQIRIKEVGEGLVTPHVVIISKLKNYMEPPNVSNY